MIPSARARKHVTRDVMGLLREHRGQKLTVARLAEMSGYPHDLVNRILCSRYSDGRYSLRRERSSFEGAIVYWAPSPEAIAGPAPEARQIVRWMLRHGKAAVPSVIAKGTGLHVEVVVSDLRRMADAGHVVRCELLTRAGVDRFEYRMSQCAEGFSPGRTIRAQVEHRA